MYELRRFKKNKKMYFYIPVDFDFTIDDIPDFKECGKSGYQNVGMSFDIETTSYETESGDHRATMYHWQFGIDKHTFTGRNWSTFLHFMELLNKKAETKKINLIVLVHNLSFEFQFIKGWFHWNRNKYNKPDIFAKDDRTILYAKWNNIEFRDTLALTGMPLKSFKKNYNLDVEKLSGDLDFTLLRGETTKLRNDEIAYCINDVQVLTDFYNKYIIPFYLAKNKQIPLTSTGIVRQEMKELFDELPKEEKKKYHRMIRNATPSRELYLVIREFLFRGGLTHANTSLCNAVLSERLASYDLKSAHPSSMLREKFPYKFYRVNKTLWRNVLEQCKSGDYSFIGCFRFKNIRAAGWHCLESKNKLINFSERAVFENGRLAYDPEEIEVLLTEIDYQNYEKMYTWDSVECDYIYQAEKKPLPDFLRKMVCRYFELKETLPKETLEYMLSKRKLNGLFGMCATGIVENDIIFDEELNEFVPSSEYKDYYKLTKNLLLLPQWAVYVAAYTRRDIVDALYNTGPDSVYYDTDSDKILNYEDYAEWFETFNAERMQKNAAMELYDFNPEHFRKIGCFELEYITDPDGFKVLGAKRYIVKHDGEISVTVAGMIKGSLEEYCNNNNLDIWKEFSNGLKLEKEYSRKQTTSYYDQGFEDCFVDYEGNEQTFRERSCVAIFDIPFEMNVEKQFLEQIIAKAKERKNQIYKGVL